MPLHHHHHHQPNNSSLRYVYRALFHEQVWCSFVIKIDGFLFWQRCRLQPVMHGGLRTSADGTHSRPISVNGSFCLTRNGRLRVGTTRSTRTFRTGCWWKTKVLRITACDHSRRTPRRLARQVNRVSFMDQFHQGHRSDQLCLRPSTFAVSTDTTPGEPFCHFSCPKAPRREAHFWAFEFLHRDRSSRSRTVPRALQCVHILWYANQTFFISYLAKTPSPLRWEYGFKIISESTDDPLLKQPTQFRRFICWR